MMRTILILMMSLFLFAFTCENDSKETQLNGLEADAMEAAEAAGLKAEDFKGNIDKLLTLEMAAQVSELPASEAEIEHSTSFLESLSYQWKSDRTRDLEVVKGNVMKIPRPNSIELSWVKNTTLEQFKHDYHNPTPEELKRAEDAIKHKMAELESDGKATNQQTSKASGIAKSAMSNFSVEEVPNLGEYAVFVNSGLMGVASRDMKVYYKGLSFTLAVDLSADKTYNDKKTIELAKMIVQKLK